MKKRYISLLAAPLLSIAACLDMSDQDPTDTSSQASMATPNQGGGGGGGGPDVRPTYPAKPQKRSAPRSATPDTGIAVDGLSTGPATDIEPAIAPATTTTEPCPQGTVCLSENGPQTGTAVFAGSPQPSAVTTDRICETYGGERCVGAPTIAFEDPVEETAGGRILQMDFVREGVKLRLNADSKKCVAVTKNRTLVEVRSCDAVDTDGRSATVWTVLFGPDGSSCIFWNPPSGNYLSGPNNGGQFQLMPKGANGWLQQFRAPALGCPGPDFSNHSPVSDVAAL